MTDPERFCMAHYNTYEQLWYLALKHSCISFFSFFFFVKLIIVEMVISLSASFHIPSGVFLKAHANHHLEACEHNKGHRRQEDNPKKPPWERIIWKMSSVDWSQHPDNLKPNLKKKKIKTRITKQ